MARQFPVRVATLAAALTLSLWGNAAAAATFRVDTARDTVDARPGDGLCADSEGSCSLRAAILEANASGDPDTIELQAQETYTLSLDAEPGMEDQGFEDDLDVSSAVALEGHGATIQRSPDPPCRLDGFSTAGEFRVFHILPGGRLEARGVTVRHGCADGSTSPGNEGGGALNLGELEITASTFRDHSARFGGGIANRDGWVKVHRSTFTGNQAHSGGAIANDNGTLTILRSRFTRNRANFDPDVKNLSGKVRIVSSRFFGDGN